MVQWLRLCAPKAGSQGSIPGQGARCQILQLRLCKTPHVTTRDPRSHNHKTYMPQLNTPHATTEIWHDQINTLKQIFFLITGRSSGFQKQPVAVPSLLPHSPAGSILPVGSTTQTSPPRPPHPRMCESCPVNPSPGA